MRRSPLLCALALLVASVSIGAAAIPQPAAELAAVDPLTGAAAPGAPGPYTGPGDAAIPTGWSPWAKDNHRQCGEMKLVFANKDLKEDDEGIVHAEGQFFIQFQAVGERAPEITRFSFSFGKTEENSLHENELINCNELIPQNPLGQGTAGAYLAFYRSDFNAEDGFFIPIETRNVPDGRYAAAVHAYTGGPGTDDPVYTEVARSWALADVLNCEGTDGSYCNGEEFDEDEAVIANDKTQPWPWVLPGDGEQTNSGTGLTIEILEPVRSINATLNGDALELREWTPPERDRDVLPMNDEEGCAANAPPACNHAQYSHGWQWDGSIEVGDIIYVEATDLNGNYVFKSMHWGVGPTGGAVFLEEPEIDFTALTHPRQTINAGETIRYDLRVHNVGGAEAHVDFLMESEGANFSAKWEDMSADHGHPTHINLAPGEQKNTYVEVQTTADTPRGTYAISAILQYPRAGEHERRAQELELTVESAVAPIVENETDGEPDVEDSPLPAAMLVAAALALLGLAASRRRR